MYAAEIQDEQGQPFVRWPPGSSHLISIAAVNVVAAGPEGDAGEVRSLATLIWAVETPAAPVIEVTDTTRDSCSIAWPAVTLPSNALILGYAMLIDDGLAGPFRVAYDGTTDPSKFATTIHGLTAQTSYRITGYALNKAGAGANATQITCFTATTPGVPGTPALVSSSSACTDPADAATCTASIEVKWQPAFDDGGSPIKEYQLWTDEVEGVGAANIETWATEAIPDSGTALTFTKTGLAPTKAHRFKVMAVSEQLLQSAFSSIAIYYAAPKPAQIAFNTVNDAHLQTSKSSIWLNWITPAINSAAELPIDAYDLYWDEGYRSSGNFTKLAKIEAYDQSFYNLTGSILKTGWSYKFQVSATNKVGEGALSTEIVARAASLPGKLSKPERTKWSYNDLAVVPVAGGGSTVSITVSWYQSELVDTGGVPLTGFKLYACALADVATCLDPGATPAFDGTGKPDVTQFTVTGLTLDEDYSFFVAALNPGQGPVSDALPVRAAALPQAPTPTAEFLNTITEVAGSRTGSSIELEWPAPAETGGSAIVSYTLAIVQENEEDLLVYHGSNRKAVVEDLSAGKEY